MEINSKKIERTSKIIYFSISVVLCVFLILLTTKFIDDIDKITLAPEFNDFEDKTVIEEIDLTIKKIEDSAFVYENKRKQIEKTVFIVRENYLRENESYENWLKARTTIGSPSNDREVLERAKKLDEFFKIEQEWTTQMRLIEDTIAQIRSQRGDLETKRFQANEDATIKYNEAMKKYDLKVFLIRLLLILPILLIGVWFVIKFRQHKYWAIFRAFVFYSVYAFFFGLVPYLPSYGGYIRYTVGIVLSLLLGIYAINFLRKYIEQKKKELETSSKERSKKVQTETAERSLLNHVCPSCGKDFILKKWEYQVPEITKNLTITTDFCRFCGLELFAKCAKCGNKNFVHLSYCSNCGEKTK